MIDADLKKRFLD